MLSRRLNSWGGFLGAISRSSRGASFRGSSRGRVRSRGRILGGRVLGANSRKSSRGANSRRGEFSGGEFSGLGDFLGGEFSDPLGGETAVHIRLSATAGLGGGEAARRSVSELFISGSPPLAGLGSGKTLSYSDPALRDLSLELFISIQTELFISGSPPPAGPGAASSSRKSSPARRLFPAAVIAERQIVSPPPSLDRVGGELFREELAAPRSGRRSRLRDRLRPEAESRI